MPKSSAARPSTVPIRQSSPQELKPKREGGRVPRGALVVLIGPAGFGKTSLAAQWPKDMWCILDKFDQGIGDLVDYGQIKADGIELPEANEVIEHDETGWRQLFKNLNAFTKRIEAGDIPATILMENMKGFETACFITHCREEYDAKMEKFQAFSNGPKGAATSEWPRFLDYVNLFRSHGVHVVITGHTAVVEKKSAEYDHPKQEPTVTPYIFDATIKDANLVAQLSLEYDVVRKGKGDFMQTRAPKDAKTKLICNKSPIYGSCKNHFGITDEIVFTGRPGDSYRQLCEAAKLNPNTFRPY